MLDVTTGVAPSFTAGPETLQRQEDNSITVPETRMADATKVTNFVQRLIDSDDKRAKKRSLVNGLVDGNPPLDPRKLRNSNQGNNCNANWGTARSYFESGTSAFYDLLTEGAGRVEVQTGYGGEYAVDYSRQISALLDRYIESSDCFDADMQLSQQDMVLHGTGPFLFEDLDTPFPVFVPTQNLLVPDRTPGNDTDRWDICAVLMEYYPPKLYEFIRNPEAAEAIGWNVEVVKEAILNAVDNKSPDQRTHTWEWWQDELKSNSFDYVNETLVCRLAHVFWKEFDGRVTHAIVDRTGIATEFLFVHQGRFESFKQCIHPMWYDRGRGGLHHNVTGLGTKMYGPMEYLNRLMCNLMDKTSAPKILFKPSSPEAARKFELARFGDYAVIPPGADAIQVPIQGFLSDGLSMYRAVDDMTRSNLSQYRQPVAPDKPGNPDTATKIKMDASQQSSLTNTIFGKYYRQVDSLYREMVMRFCNINSTCRIVQKFQKELEDLNVPKECLGRITSVKAVRVVGQGSPFMRQQAVSSVGQVIGGCSEDGQAQWRDDFIAATAGHAAVARWNPRNKLSQAHTEQLERASNQISNMKIGIPAIVGPGQNPSIFAGAFIKAASEALASLPKGGDPMQVAQFVDLVAPAAWKHVKRLVMDPLHKRDAQVFEQHLKKIGAILDKLKKQLAAQQQQRQQQQQKTQAAMSDAQIKAMKVKGDLQLKAQKQQANLAMQRQAHQQRLGIADATAASQIATNHYRVLSE